MKRPVQSSLLSAIILSFWLFSGFVLKTWADPASQPHEILNIVRVSDAETGAQKDELRPLGKVSTVEFERIQPHLGLSVLNLLTENRVLKIAFPITGDAGIFKSALEKFPNRYQLIAHWTQKEPCRFVAPVTDPSLIVKGIEICEDRFADSVQNSESVLVRDLNTNKTYNMTGFLQQSSSALPKLEKSAAKKQIREQQLNKGTYEGVLGFLQRTMDQIHHLGVFADSNRDSKISSNRESSAAPPTSVDTTPGEISTSILE
jgi:hypothetical protein